jgi:hypothetical protein
MGGWVLSHIRKLLIEAGFEYIITTTEGLMLSKKPKRVSSIPLFSLEGSLIQEGS